MGLVDYDSDSASSSGEQPAKAQLAPPSATAIKKPFRKLVDRANPGKIIVSLPSTVDQEADTEDARPAKRARTGGGASRFSGFGSMLPAPKKSVAPTPATSATSPAAAAAAAAPSRPRVNLKTSSDAAFSRQAADGGGDAGDGPATAKSVSMSLLPHKAPSIPQGQKAAEDVKIVGNPLMFLPLSVSRKPAKKKKPSGAAAAAAGKSPATASASPFAAGASASPAASVSSVAPAAPKKISLFSVDTSAEEEAARAEDEDASADAAAGSSAYQPMFQDTFSAYETQVGELQQQQQPPPPPQSDAPKTLDAIADDLHLSARERRELFGRGGTAGGAVAAATFNMDREYQHNERMRQSGEAEQQLAHNPVRAVMPGRHSLRQLVTAVTTQQDALEEAFAKNRASQRESGSRYGWR